MSDEILFEVRGRAGIVTLNRPKALNALSQKMVEALGGQLSRWADDPAVAHVVIKAAGERAFCAGGDIRSIYEARMAGDMEGLRSFFRAEYMTNAQIKAFPKPYIALINGIVMGGGVGVSVHGSHRVGTEKTVFAMPETGIGFFPDVGGTFFLPRMPKRTGVYCALSAGRLKQADALATGVLTHAVREADLPALEAALEEADNIDQALSAFRTDPGAGDVWSNAALIEEIFSGGSVGEIMTRLDASQDPFAVKAAEAIRQKSPASVHIAFEQMQRGAALSFNDCMKLEYRILCRIAEGTDFFEGVRAVVIDKDNKPKWSPANLSEVDSAGIASYFETPPNGDLPLS